MIVWCKKSFLSPLTFDAQISNANLRNYLKIVFSEASINIVMADLGSWE